VDSGRDADLEELLNLATEAKLEAVAVLSGAELSLVGYATASRYYTFRFTEPGSSNEVSVLGPYRTPAPQRWEIIQEQRPTGVPRLDALDVTALRNSPKAVAEAAEGVTSRPASNMGINVWSDGGQLTWNAMAPLGENSIVSCVVLDSVALSAMTCDIKQP
jgi:hypothetical protein